MTSAEIDELLVVMMVISDAVLSSDAVACLDRLEGGEYVAG